MYPQFTINLSKMNKTFITLPSIPSVAFILANVLSDLPLIRCCKVIL